MKIPLRKRNEIIKQFLPRIKYIVKSIKQDNLPPVVSEDDLYQAAVLGLIDAIEKYNPDKGVQLSTYAEIRIRGYIIDTLRKLDFLPRNVRKASRDIENAIIELEQKLGREATTEEIAEYLGMSVEEYMKYAEKIFNNGLVSIETNISSSNENDTTKLWQIIPVNDDTPEKYVEREELKRILAQAIEKLNEREKLVISLYYYEELSMKEIGEILGLTESRISQIHTKTMLKLRKLLNKYVNREDARQ